MTQLLSICLTFKIQSQALDLAKIQALLLGNASRLVGGPLLLDALLEQILVYNGRLYRVVKPVHANVREC